MADTWPKKFRMRLRGWGYAREAQIQLGIDPGAAERMAREVDKISVTVEVHQDGTVSMLGTEGPVILPGCLKYIHIGPLGIATEEPKRPEVGFAVEIEKHGPNDGQPCPQSTVPCQDCEHFQDCKKVPW